MKAKEKPRSNEGANEFKFGVDIDPQIEQLVRELPKNSKVLELGPGLGGNAIFLADKGFDVTCIDRDKDAIEHIKRECPEIEAINQDVLIYDFHSAKYDFVMSRNFLHLFRLPEIKSIIEKMINSLKDGGLLYIMVRSVQDATCQRFLASGQEMEEKNTFYSKKHKGFRHFFSKEEIEQIFAENKVLEIEDKIIEEDHPPSGKHKHGVIRAVIRKRRARK